MPAQETLLLGEFRRTIDQRFRLSVPAELADVLQQQGTDLILAKERRGQAHSRQAATTDKSTTATWPIALYSTHLYPNGRSWSVGNTRGIPGVSRSRPRATIICCGSVGVLGNMAPRKVGPILERTNARIPRSV